MAGKTEVDERTERVRRQAAEALREAAEVWLTGPKPALGGEWSAP